MPDITESSAGKLRAMGVTEAELATLRSAGTLQRTDPATGAATTFSVTGDGSVAMTRVTTTTTVGGAAGMAAQAPGSNTFVVQPGADLDQVLEQKLGVAGAASAKASIQRAEQMMGLDLDGDGIVGGDGAAPAAAPAASAPASPIAAGGTGHGEPAHVATSAAAAAAAAEASAAAAMSPVQQGGTSPGAGGSSGTMFAVLLLALVVAGLVAWKLLG